MPLVTKSQLESENATLREVTTARFRTFCFGILAVAWGILAGDSKSVVSITDWSRWALFAIAAGTIVFLLLDSIEPIAQVARNKRSLKRLSLPDEETAHMESRIARSAFFGKQGVLILLAAAFLFVIGSSILSSLGYSQNQPAVKSVKGFWETTDDPSSHITLLLNETPGGYVHGKLNAEFDCNGRYSESDARLLLDCDNNQEHLIAKVWSQQRVAVMQVSWSTESGQKGAYKLFRAD